MLPPPPPKKMLESFYFGDSGKIVSSVTRAQQIYRVIQNDCRGFNNLPYTIHLR